MNERNCTAPLRRGKGDTRDPVVEVLWCETALTKPFEVLLLRLKGSIGLSKGHNLYCSRDSVGQASTPRKASLASGPGANEPKGKLS